MTKSVTKRPAAFRKPAYWSDAPPPEPHRAEGTHEGLAPTRYGDWVRNGIAIDF